MNKNMVLQQICLITDGCSNVGMSPVDAAELAREEGQTVNVIGVIDHGDLGEQGSQEIQAIARAGGGLSRIVPIAQLAYTVQMMTRQAATQTIHQAVNHELKQILAGSTLEELPPAQRGQIVQVMDQWAETSEIRVLLLIDTSLSMKPKLAAVQEAIHDLQLSLSARKGKSELLVMTYPGEHTTAQLQVPWTTEASQLNHLFGRVKPRGATPTGPALMEASMYLSQKPLKPIHVTQQAQGTASAKKGWMEEYVF